MLAVGLGWAAVEAGYRVHYTTAADLAARCHRAALEGRWASMMRFYAGPRLLLVDEVGYLPMAGEAGAALFQVVTQRYLKGSVVLTTNLGVVSCLGAHLRRPDGGRRDAGPAAASKRRVQHRRGKLSAAGPPGPGRGAPGQGDQNGAFMWLSALLK